MDESIKFIHNTKESILRKIKNEYKLIIVDKQHMRFRIMMEFMRNLIDKICYKISNESVLSSIIHYKIRISLFFYEHISIRTLFNE